MKEFMYFKWKSQVLEITHCGEDFTSNEKPSGDQLTERYGPPICDAPAGSATNGIKNVVHIPFGSCGLRPASVS
jgi:hypothetical protein